MHRDRENSLGNQFSAEGVLLRDMLVDYMIMIYGYIMIR